MTISFKPIVPFRRFWIAAIPAALLCIGILNPCLDRTHLYPATILSALFLSLWATQYSIAAGELTSKWYEYPMSLLYDFCFLLVVFFIISLLFGSTAYCYKDRMKVADVMSSLSSLKAGIGDRLSNGKEIQPMAKDNPSDLANVTFLEVDKEGKVLLIIKEPNAILRLIPERKEQDIRWSCFGRPAKFFPAACR